MTLWFTETEYNHQTQVSWKVDQIKYRGQSDFQKVEVFATDCYGLMLVIDGCVMLTETDEFIYHEMIAHIPALLHPSPKDVLVIGGGDGGTVRELLKHPTIQKITLCELDPLVIDTAKKYFPRIASGLADPRVTIKIGDGVAAVARLDTQVDLVIVDSTDPIGPGEGLFSGNFYHSVARALRPGGLMVAQSESPWFPAAILQRIHRNIKQGFAFQKPYVAPVPTYPRGLWSWTLASQAPIDFSSVDPNRLNGLIAKGLKYLNKGIMHGTGDIPQFYKEKIEDYLGNAPGLAS